CSGDDRWSAGFAGATEGRKQTRAKCSQRGAAMMVESKALRQNGEGGVAAAETHVLERPQYDPTAPSAIEVDHIVKKYGEFTAVKEVSFSVKEGEIFGLLGPNGAGKSTLIRMMTTLIPITSGRASIAGHDVAKDPNAARRLIGVIPQALTSD